MRRRRIEHISIPTTESGMVLPPATDEDRQVGPALYHEQSQGGPTESKLKQSTEYLNGVQQFFVESSTDLPQGHISAFRYELLTEAKARYAKFKGIDPSEVSECQLSRTSLGVEGWACAHVLDSDLSGSSRGDHSCCAFGGRGGYGDDPGSPTSRSSSDLSEDEHNAQVMRLIIALGRAAMVRDAVPLSKLWLASRASLRIMIESVCMQ